MKRFADEWIEEGSTVVPLYALPQIAGLVEALMPFAVAYDMADPEGAPLTMDEVRMMYDAVSIPDFRRASLAFRASQFKGDGDGR